MLAWRVSSAHDGRVLDAQEIRELARLRARAYAPDGDLRDDPSALVRLQQLEDRAHAGDAVVPDAAPDLPSGGVPAQESPVSARRRWRFAAILVAVVAVTAAVSAAVATTIAAPEPADPVRFQTIVQGEGWLTDSTSAVIDCLEADAWQVEWDEATGTLGFTDEREGHAAAVRACAATVRAEYDDRIRELRGLRWYPVEMRIASCLRAQGIDVPELPSRREFAALYDTPDAWTAYGFVTDLSPEEWGRISAACPPDAE